MKLPLSWLKEFVAIDVEVAELSRRLTAGGIEVESIESIEPAFTGVIVAKVLSVGKHPNADRLSVCEVDAGAAGKFKVVCGAPNVKRGMKAALATVGAQLARGGHGSLEKPPPLAASEIRGVQSEGMLCSERELGFSDSHAGIMALESNAPVGTALAAYLGLQDTVLDIAITANRGDCLSVLGLSREIAALFGARLKEPKLISPSAPQIAAGDPSAAAFAPFPVEIQAPQMCPHYAALAMDGIKDSSVAEMAAAQARVCGMRPLNNVVDVTNYVMLERGQPLHAFDLAQIEDRRIVVRRAGDYFQFVTLDNLRRDLEPSDLMIADGRKLLAIAGVMGGLNSEVSDATAAILIESACFDPMAIARTSRRLGLRSEASYRFERGIDRNGQVPAVIRAAALIGKIAGGREAGAITDIEPTPAPKREIDFDLDAMASMLGVEIPSGEVKRRLRALGAVVEPGAKAHLKITPPSFRPDLNEQADLVEEVARLNGLEDVPAVLAPRAAAPRAENPERAFTRRAREVLLGCGLTEIKTINFIAPSDNARFPGLFDRFGRDSGTPVTNTGPPQPQHQETHEQNPQVREVTQMNETPETSKTVATVDLARRAFLGTSAIGLGSIALSSLLARGGFAGVGGAPAFAFGDDTPTYKLGKATARRVIMIFAAGGLSQHDLFDEKPLLNKRRGEELPDSVRRGQRITGVTEKQGALPVVGSCFEFKPYGKSGLRMSELFREMGAFADDFCLVRSMQTDHVLHEAAMSILFTGSMQLGRPSWGSWVTYALGTENKDLPEFVVMLSGRRDGGSPPHPRMWHNGYLPGRYQGCPFRSGKEPVFFVSNPDGVDAKTRRRILDTVQALNEREAATTGDPEVAARIHAYEMAARMQTSVPELTDLSKEPAEVLEQYGAEPGKESFANNCLLARRLAERGVRFIQLMDSGWDHHNAIPIVLKKKMEEADKPIAALLGDLKQSGLLEDTLVVFCGEFGRTSYCEGPMSFASYGRDHHQLCGGMLLAGAGFRGGFAYGETDEWGWDVVKDPAHVHDVQATILHALGLDHLRLVTRYQGRDFRLTDVGGNVLKPLLA